jgi:hypothetical protein
MATKWFARYARNPAFDDVPILMMSAALPQQLPVDDLVDHFLPKGTGLAKLVTTIRHLIETGGKPFRADSLMAGRLLRSGRRG